MNQITAIASSTRLVSKVVYPFLRGASAGVTKERYHGEPPHVKVQPAMPSSRVYRYHLAAFSLIMKRGAPGLDGWKGAL